MRRKVISLIMIIFLLMQSFVYAEELSITTTKAISQSVVYPNLGNEKSVDPSINFYYVIHYDVLTKTHLKTEEYRFADKRLMRIAYPDRRIDVIDSTPLSEDKILEYSVNYGFTPQEVNSKEIEPQEVKPQEPEYLVSLKNLLKEKKITFFVNTYVRVGYQFDIDKRVENILETITLGQVKNLKESAYDKVDLSDIKKVNKEIRSIKELSKRIEVMIVPYASDQFEEGLIFEINGEKGNEIILLFSGNQTSIKKQFDIQVNKYFNNK